MSKVQTDWKIKPLQVKSVDDIRKVFEGRKGRGVSHKNGYYNPLEFRLLLQGGSFSLKIINYYPMRKKKWDVFHSISDFWQGCTDESLAACLHGKDGELFNFWFIPDGIYKRLTNQMHRSSINHISPWEVSKMTKATGGKK